MERIQKSLLSAVVLTELSHVFCCVLPTLFSVLSLLSGLGLIGSMPRIFVHFHNIMHAWEVPMIVTSALILLTGWGIDFVSRKVDCHDTGCGHGPCEPRKVKAHTIMKVATVLFLINVCVYTVFHRGMDVFPSSSTVIETVHSSSNHSHP